MSAETAAGKASPIRHGDEHKQERLKRAAQAGVAKAARRPGSRACTGRGFIPGANRPGTPRP